jgi:PPK2 family polyphosphate:nucleotide phosphotransferase
VKTLEALIVEPGKAARLDRRETAWDGAGELQGRRNAEEALARSVTALEQAQELLWASGRHALLVVFQAMDAGGKDGTIRHVTSGVNPAGVDVVAFKQPSAEELSHDFLWRVARALPARGRIVIFNRSHYEEVVAVRLHPEWLDRQGVDPDGRDERFWNARFDSINAFEHHVTRSGTKIVKLFLHVSREEQRRRLLARLEDPDKEWKFSAGDLAERTRWDEYMAAYEAAITATSTRWAPWYVVPADRKPQMRALTAHVIVEAVASLSLSWPVPSAEERAANAAARAQLEAEG